MGHDVEKVRLRRKRRRNGATGSMFDRVRLTEYWHVKYTELMKRERSHDGPLWVDVFEKRQFRRKERRNRVRIYGI